MRKENLFLRSATLIAGLFIMALGVALSVKANLGVSPISCIPYVYSVRFPLTMGETTIIFNVLLILLQMLVLGKSYKPVQLLQVPVVLVFGFFTDLGLWLLSGVHAEGYVSQLLLCLSSCAVIAFAVFVEVKANVTYLAGEGLALALSERFHIEFGKAKIATDCTMVVFGILSSLVFFRHVAGVREGTVVAALFVGWMARIFSRRLTFLDRLSKTAAASSTPIQHPAVPQRLVITISREFGSGGREVGRLVAEKLGLKFYDKNLVGLTAALGGFTPAYIHEHEQRLANSLLFSLYEQNYAYVNEQRPPLDALFLVQSKILRDIAERESCVIVGRCADYVLKDTPGCFNVYIHADLDFRKKRYISEYSGNPETAERDLEKINRDRINYCRHYTGRERGRADNYDLTLDSSLLGIEGAADVIVDVVKRTILKKDAI